MKNTQDEFLDEILEITKENFISDNDFNHIQRNYRRFYLENFSPDLKMYSFIIILIKLFNDEFKSIENGYNELILIIKSNEKKTELKIDKFNKLNNCKNCIEFFENEIYNYTEFVDDILKQSENSKENTETPEIDYSNTPPLERMIILEKLGIIKYIQSIQKDSKNEKETARILSSFTGINTGTVAKNLGVMLGHKKNDSDKNSPYNNPKNQQLADNKLINFNIDLTKIIK